MIKISDGWGVYSDEGNVIHVIPQIDTDEHSHDLSFEKEPTDYFKENLEKGILIIDKYIEFKSLCECVPKILYEENSWHIIHNSFDGRENFEADNKVRYN